MLFALDIDECEEETYSCPKFSRCKNKNGGYDCPCKDGFEKTAQGTCSEICTPECDENSYCENGKCLCRRGFSLGLDYTCQPSEGETSTDRRVAMRGLLQKLAVKIVECYRNSECQNRMKY
ncbi:nephronectin-like isoform X1 [Orbicella faveolata]|uniref:nephronectin-like isoform X1 n=1 Tax=Orbicella faveolata TaxID=48498 RepID=UPI0009E4F1E0|nr:nephronectin-like isoform X1 [Orbicella faveolata]